MMRNFPLFWPVWPGENGMKANPGKPDLLRTACLTGLLSLAFYAYGQEPAAGKPASATMQEAKGIKKGITMQVVTSKDGTRIAYDKMGKGPALILVGGALSARSGASELAGLLAPNFTVYSYDRRGRGESADTKLFSKPFSKSFSKPDAIKREIEDMEALVDQAGSSAYVYGKSSGACLALEAASSLGDKVKKLVLYEAPYSEEKGAAEEWKGLVSKIDKLLAADQRAEAVTKFMKFVGAPDKAIEGMKASPAWPAMVAMAPTLAYDNAVVGENRSVPVERAAKVKAKTWVMDGGASLETMPFMRPTADKIAKAIPHARRHTVEGQGHDVDSKVLAPILVKFFSD
jgi:pimeloyl-ACP methyl ester carboxylesterase